MSVALFQGILMQCIFHSSLYFEAVAYDPRTQILMLRGTDRTQQPYLNTDLLFGGVQYLELESQYGRGITIYVLASIDGTQTYELHTHCVELSRNKAEHLVEPHLRSAIYKIKAKTFHVDQNTYASTDPLYVGY